MHANTNILSVLILLLLFINNYFNGCCLKTTVYTNQKMFYCEWVYGTMAPKGCREKCTLLLSDCGCVYLALLYRKKEMSLESTDTLSLKFPDTTEALPSLTWVTIPI